MNTNNRWQNIATKYIQWFLVTLVGFLVVQVVASGLASVSGSESLFFLLYPVLSFMFGGVFGYFQSRLIKLEAEHKNIWIVMVAVSMVAKNLTMDFKFGNISNVTDLIPAFIAGGVVGLAQFLVLRKITSEAIWWLPASTLAWGLGISISWPAYDYYHIGFFGYSVVIGVINGLLTAVPFANSFSKSATKIFDKVILIAFSLSIPVAAWFSMTVPNSQQDARFSVTNSVQQLLFSPDSKILAVAYSFGGVELRNVNNWEKIGHINLKSQDSLEGIAFSPDGQIMAIGTSRGKNVIELWRLPSMEYIGDLQGHTGWVNGVVFSPNGQWIASAGGEDDRRVILWEVSNREMIRVVNTLPSGMNWFNDVAFSPDGHMLAAAILQNGNGGVKIWDSENNEVQHEFVDFPDPVYKVLFSPDGHWLAVGSENIVKIFDVSTWQEFSTINIGSGSISSFSFSPNSQVLAVGPNESVELWNIQNGVQIAILKGHKNGYLAIAVSPDGQWLASASRFGFEETPILIWRLESYLP